MLMSGSIIDRTSIGSDPTLLDLLLNASKGQRPVKSTGYAPCWIPICCWWVTHLGQLASSGFSQSRILRWITVYTWSSLVFQPPSKRVPRCSPSDGCLKIGSPKLQSLIITFAFSISLHHLSFSPSETLKMSQCNIHKPQKHIQKPWHDMALPMALPIAISCGKSQEKSQRSPSVPFGTMAGGDLPDPRPSPCSPLVDGLRGWAGHGRWGFRIGTCSICVFRGKQIFGVDCICPCKFQVDKQVERYY